MKKRSLLFFSLFLVVFLLGAPSSKASSFKNQGVVIINADEVVTSNFYVIANEILIDGKIAGDLIAVAKNIKINGEIAGDLIAVASEIEINGRIEGNSRIIFNNFNLNGFIGKNINALGENLSLNKESFVGWDLLSSTRGLFLGGLINGNVNVSAENILLDTKINKNSKIKLEGNNQNLTISPETIIGGNFIYSAQNEIKINNEENFQGEIEFNKYSASKKRSNKNSNNLIFSILAALVMSIFLVYVLKGLKSGVIKNLNEFNKKDLLPALLFLILTPIASVLIFITLIGIPLSLLIFITYFITIYLSKIISAIFITELLFDKFGKNKHYFLFLFLGVSGSWLIFSLPILGNIVSVVATIFGLSALIKYVKNKSTNI